MEEKNYRRIEDLPLTIRVEDLMPVLSIGRNSAYELVRSGKTRSVRIGRQLRIPRDAVIEFLEGEREQL
ncbi:MAG: helix-turn-helix domain-containing protein [Oscillospiraceae bacterium]|nr:helix-turn-helix domain-containing protein [Oscillospiraceae bacterium]